MIVFGLTGSIATGKSETAKMFRALKVPVFDADAQIHDMLANDKAVIAAVRKKFPTVVVKNKIDRKRLGEIVFNNKPALKSLEKILHPRNRKAAQDFIKQQRARKQRLVVLDIPLLYESGAEKLCDKVIVVTVPSAVQRARALARGLSPSRFRAIRNLQMKEPEKRKRADILLWTHHGKAFTRAQVRDIIKHA